MTNNELSVVHYFLDEEIFPDLESYCASNAESIKNKVDREVKEEDYYSHVDINELNSSKQSQNDILEKQIEEKELSNDSKYSFDFKDAKR